MDMTIVFGVGMFTAIVLVLVVIILYARSHLVSAGGVSILINEYNCHIHISSIPLRCRCRQRT